MMNFKSRVCQTYAKSIGAISSADTSVVSVQHGYACHVQVSRYHSFLVGMQIMVNKK